MELSDTQHEVVRKAAEWWNNGNPLKQTFRLFGVAGSGKSTLAEYIVEALDLGNIQVATFSGKAAHVLRTKGFPDARTIHNLIYRPIEKGRGRVPQLLEDIEHLRRDGAPQEMIDRIIEEIRREKDGLRQPAWSLNPDSDLLYAQILILDEVSQIPENIAKDLLSFGKPLLVLGDPAQLPPIKGTGYFMSEPDVFMTEVHRQAKDSAVLRMATIVREGGRLQPGVYEDVSGLHSEVVSRPDADRLIGCDMLLVGRNATRHKTNSWIRKRNDRKSFLPEQGEKLVCLRNRGEYGIMNGAIYQATKDSTDIDHQFALACILSEDIPELGEQEMMIHKRLLGGDPAALDPWEWNDAQAFDWGYAITTHKAQGSSWPHVAIKDEWNFANHSAWLYTACTRASKFVYLVLD